MRGIIWYGHDNRDNATIQINRIKRAYAHSIWDREKHFGWNLYKTDEENINEVIEKELTSFSEHYVKFINGDEWRIVPASENMRGHSCNISYIDRTIPQDIVE